MRLAHSEISFAVPRKVIEYWVLIEVGAHVMCGCLLLVIHICAVSHWNLMLIAFATGQEEKGRWG